MAHIFSAKKLCDVALSEKRKKARVSILLNAGLCVPKQQLLK